MNNGKLVDALIVDNIVRNYLEQRALETNNTDLLNQVIKMSGEELIGELNRWKKEK